MIRVTDFALRSASFTLFCETAKMATSFSASDIMEELQKNMDKMKEFSAQLEESFKENGMDGIQRFADQKLGGWKNVKVNKVSRWQNLIPSFPWIAPGWRAWGRNPSKEGIQFCSAA